MPENRSFNFDEIGNSDLIVDALYKGGKSGNAGDDPISKILGCGNQGGFRFSGSAEKFNIKYCVLYSSLSDMEWADVLDVENGRFMYYGDNKKPGSLLHDTPKKGNIVLKKTFDMLHLNEKKKIPPFFIFTKAPEGRDVVFRGLAVPGARNMISSDDLVAVWKSMSGERFQNYKAIFSILDAQKIKRKWINDIQNGTPFTENAPKAWIDWTNDENRNILIAVKSRLYRSKTEQLPSSKKKTIIVTTIVNYFKRHPHREYAFEKCAAEIARLLDKNIIEYDLTRPWRDGGRDAIGKYRIGYENSSIFVDFALEAKCKSMSNGSGVKETSRLISRLRYRQFGIFVTTSYIGEQAYKEIIEDGHPVLILTGEDVANILIAEGINTTGSLMDWLEEHAPRD